MGMRTSLNPADSNKQNVALSVDILGVQVTLMDSVTRTAFSSTANFEARSSKLLNVRTAHGLSRSLSS